MLLFLLSLLLFGHLFSLLGLRFCFLLTGNLLLLESVGLSFSLKLLFMSILSFLLLFNYRLLISIRFCLLLSQQHLLFCELDHHWIILGQSGLLHHSFSHHKLSLLLNGHLLIQFFFGLILNFNERIVILLQVIFGLVELLLVFNKGLLRILKLLVDLSLGFLQV